MNLKTQAMSFLKDVGDNDEKLVQLKAVFDKFRDQKDYRNPFIGIPKDDDEKILLAAAIIYYHGRIPTTYAGNGVQSLGYDCW